MKKPNSLEPKQCSTVVVRRSNQRSAPIGLLILAVALPVALLAGTASAQQYPLLDAAANKVIQKYQNSSCEQLRQERAEPRPEREQRMVDFLRGDPQMRRAFIDRVAAPVANKMFECGMIP
jgi:hypothetical protein